MDAPPITDGAHVFLHVNLCAAVARTAETRPVPIRVTLTDRVGNVEFKRTVRIDAADGSEPVVEFDSHFGVFALNVASKTPACEARDFVAFSPNRPRTLDETLAPSPAPPPSPVVLVDGAAPQSFVYVKPTFVFFAGTLPCGGPVGTPLAIDSRVQYERTAFHAQISPLAFAPHGAPTGVSESPGPSPTATPPAVTMTLRLRTPTGLAHYVRVPIPFPWGWGGWPAHIQFDLSEDAIDGLATDKTDTLLCPKFTMTRSG